jgi:uncharacterized membrane protein YGL010W
MRTMQTWLDEYGESHQDHTNELIHWICVPTIFFCVVGFLVSIPPIRIPGLAYLRIDVLVMALALFFYFMRSKPLWIGMTVFTLACWLLARWLDVHAPWPLWLICLVLFALAWVGQFIGHKIEGKKPSFLKDLQFLLIGPAWLMSKIYDRAGIRY